VLALVAVSDSEKFPEISYGGSGLVTKSATSIGSPSIIFQGTSSGFWNKGIFLAEVLFPYFRDASAALRLSRSSLYIA